MTGPSAPPLKSQANAPIPGAGERLQTGIPVIPDRAPSSDQDHQVLPFRRRGAPPSNAFQLRWPARAHPGGDDLARYERGGAEDNYRHRMLVNLAGLVVAIMLATAGAWLAITIADMRKNQDCYLSGRRNCTPIDVQSLQNR